MRVGWWDIGKPSSYKDFTVVQEGCRMTKSRPRKSRMKAPRAGRRIVQLGAGRETSAQNGASYNEHFPIRQQGRGVTVARIREVARGRPCLGKWIVYLGTAQEETSNLEVISSHNQHFAVGQ